MYQVYNKDSNVMIDFELGELKGTCNYTQGTIESIIVPDEEEYDDSQSTAYVLALTPIIEMSKPFLGKTETNNWIAMFAQPNVKISTDIKLEVLSDA